MRILLDEGLVNGFVVTHITLVTKPARSLFPVVLEMKFTWNIARSAKGTIERSPSRDNRSWSPCTVVVKGTLLDSPILQLELSIEIVPNKPL